MHARRPLLRVPHPGDRLSRNPDPSDTDVNRRPGASGAAVALMPLAIRSAAHFMPEWICRLPASSRCRTLSTLEHTSFASKSPAGVLPEYESYFNRLLGSYRKIRMLSLSLPGSP